MRNPASVLALVFSIAALGLAGWAVFRPAPERSATPEYDSVQQADAKATACAAAELVRRGVSMNTNLQSPGGESDVTGSLAVAANARISLSAGGQYLLDQVGPATPTAVADAVTKFARTLMEIGAAATAGALNTDPEQADRLRNADAQNATIVDACR